VTGEREESRHHSAEGRLAQREGRKTGEGQAKEVLPGHPDHVKKGFVGLGNAIAVKKEGSGKKIAGRKNATGGRGRSFPHSRRGAYFVKKGRKGHRKKKKTRKKRLKVERASVKKI